MPVRYTYPRTPRPIRVLALWQSGYTPAVRGLGGNATVHPHYVNLTFVW